MSQEHERTGRVSIRIGNRNYPAIRSNRCRVCLHPGRPEIEEKLLYHEPYRRIASWVSYQVQSDGSTWSPLSEEQISRHFKRGHCPIDTRVLHELAEEMGHDYEASLTRIVSPVLLARQTLSQVQECLIRGEIVPTLKDGLAAASLLHQIEASSRTLEQGDRSLLLEQAMMAYFAEAQKIMTPEQWERLGHALAVSPVLREIEHKMAELDVVEAQVLEDA